MRNIHTHMISEYGKEKVKILWQWEKTEMKMADLKKSQVVYIQMPQQQYYSSQCATKKQHHDS